MALKRGNTLRVADEISAKLTEAFHPEALEVIDESEAHRGHGGYREGGQSHFKVVIKAAAFAPMSRIKRHRAVHAALTPELVQRIHALSLDISA